MIVAGYSLSRAFQRVRALRKDGRESLLAVLVALLYLADLQTGFIGKPRNGGGPWHRYTLADIAQMAFGSQDKKSLRRVRRAMDMAISLRFLSRTKQVRRYRPENDTFVGLAGVRHLNLDRICEVCGTTWLLNRDRRYARKNKVSNVTAMQPQRGQKHQLTGRDADKAQVQRAAAAHRRIGRPPNGDPNGVGAQEIARITQLLSDKG